MNGDEQHKFNKTTQAANDSANSAQNSETAATAASVAAVTAASVAANAVEVARAVAENAIAVASKVAETTAKTSESVLLLSQDIKYMKDNMAEIKVMLDSKYVTNEEHDSVLKDISLLQKIVFTGIGAILLTILGAGLSMLLKK